MAGPSVVWTAICGGVTNSIMSINGTWGNPTLARCFGKREYGSIVVAEQVAEKASCRTGELIIAYQCYDCMRFHIGHADESQKIVRSLNSPLPFLCPNCNGPIPDPRRFAAKESSSPTVYCSAKCRKASMQRRKRAHRANRINEGSCSERQLNAQY